MYRIVDQQGRTQAIATRLEDAEAMTKTLSYEPPLKIVVDNPNK